MNKIEKTSAGAMAGLFSALTIGVFLAIVFASIQNGKDARSN